jgi:Fe-S-cluster containining protein
MDGIALNSIDVVRMAKHMGMDKNDFMREYTVASLKLKTDRWYKPVGDTKMCPFLTSEGCSQYEGRGQVCRHYPWFSVPSVTALRSKKPMAIFITCPGTLHTLDTMLHQALEMDTKEATDILKSDVGKFCFLHMELAIGNKEGFVDRSIKQMGYANLPTEEALKGPAWAYAVAVMTLWGERKIRNTLEVVSHFV